jgi:serine/threonine protein kinase
MLAGEPPFREEDDGPSLLRRMESGRYRSLRRAAPGTPRPLKRLVRRCLRPRPSKRFGSATELRRALERFLDAPSPADCRAEIAAALWESKVFVSEEGDATRVKPPAPRRRRRRLASLTAAAAVLAAALAVAAGSSWLSLSSLPILSSLIDISAPR